jgi:hypothetical protein
MAITKLNTYEGVPIGRENFEEYTNYLSDLVARSNPFLETTASDINDIVVLGEGQFSAKFEDAPFFNVNNLTINNLNTNTRFVYRPMNFEPSDSTSLIEHTEQTLSDVLNINPEVPLEGTYFLRITVSYDGEDSNIRGSFNISVDGTPVSEEFTIDSSDFINNAFYYVSFPYTSILDDIQLNLTITEAIGDSHFNFECLIYRAMDWEEGVSYVINYKALDPKFEFGLSGILNVYFADENSLSATDYSPTLIDSVKLYPGNGNLGSLVFKPDSTYENGSIIFEFEDSEDYFISSLPISIDFYKLIDTNIISLSGSSTNSYAFISDDERKLYTFKTNLIQSDVSTPGVRSWEIPLSSISEIVISEDVSLFGYTKDKLPVVFSKIYSSDYASAKSNKETGVYSKGILLATINGVPQVGDDHISVSGFYDTESLVSSDMLLFNSFRFGAEYPTARYSNIENHQYANQIIDGFSYINSSQSSLGNSLSNTEFNNTLYFPFTDFLLNPILVLVHQRVSDNLEDYYYIPMDTDFSSEGIIRFNHYKIEDPSSGKVRFNFRLPIGKEGDRFRIVSIEQLQEASQDGVTEYVSKYGTLYSPTSNFDLTTKILSFDPTLLLATNLETSLPKINLIPSTKIITSSGRAIIRDSEGEFTRSSLYGFSYPGRVIADELVKIQAIKYEPDILKLYYYPDTTAFEFYKQSVPYPVYIHIAKNEVSWYNRGINRVIYDPIPRADANLLHVAAEFSSRPPNSATLGELSRRSTLNAFTGTITANDTNFMGNLNRNTFIVANNAPVITSVNAGRGSLLVGSGVESSPPRELPRGELTQVLTATDNDIYWSYISTAAWTQLNGYSQNQEYQVTATDNSILQIFAATDQLNLIVSDFSTPTEYSTSLSLSLADEVYVKTLYVSDSANLPSIGTVPGTYGSSTSIPQLNIEADGRVYYATDIVIDTNAWTFISDGTNTIEAGTTETLTFSPRQDQIRIIATDFSGSSDVIFVFLSSDVRVDRSLSTPLLRLPHQPSISLPEFPASTLLSSTDGNMWTYENTANIRMSGNIRTFAFVDYHTHNASDIVAGVLDSRFGGTGFGSDVGDTFLNGQILIGNSETNSWSKSAITADVASGIVIRNGPGQITIAARSNSENQINAIVIRDANGNFSSNTITASLNGNAATSSALNPGRTVNGVLFNGTQNINVPTQNPLAFGIGLRTSTTGSTRDSFNGLNPRTVAVNPIEVVMIDGAQTILGAKTFTTIILPVKTG